MDKHQRKSQTLESNKKLSVAGNKQEPQRSKSMDKYFVPRDYIWKDAVIHEKRLKKSWDSVWGELVMSQQQEMNVFAKDLQQKRQNVLSVRSDASLVNAAGESDVLEFIKSSNTQKGLNALQSQEIIKVDYNKLYRTSGPLPKIRFVPEQYGHYRILKCLHGETKVIDDVKPEILSQVKHTVNPLLC